MKIKKMKGEIRKFDKKMKQFRKEKQKTISFSHAGCYNFFGRYMPGQMTERLKEIWITTY